MSLNVLVGISYKMRGIPGMTPVEPDPKTPGTSCYVLLYIGENHAGGRYDTATGIAVDDVPDASHPISRSGIRNKYKVGSQSETSPKQ